MDIPSNLSDTDALQAVRDRDAAYDGKLFYAVVTTGIYCRPSCSARQARTENIRFFNSAQSAVSAGFRACKRCKPDNLSISKTTCANAIIDIARFIEAHADEKLTLAMLSKRFELSPTYLQKAFSATLGVSPKVFQEGVRQQRFKSLLQNQTSVTNAVFAAGYGSSSRVYENATEQLGMTPGVYKKGGIGEQINYTCGDTQFGELMLAATEKGVCFVMFGSQEVNLLSMLTNEFPHAIINHSNSNAQINAWFIEIDQYLSAATLMPSIPLDLRGSAFQMRVWQFLQSIGNGTVVSYRDVAQGIDQPTAIRAAATACAKNKVALLIPCHRVLRGDGGIGGYRWGVEAKKKLLAMEKSNSV